MLGFAGVALIFAGPGHDTAGTSGAAPLGYAAALGSALCMTAYTLGPGRLPVTVTDLLLPATTGRGRRRGRPGDDHRLAQPRRRRARRRDLHRAQAGGRGLRSGAHAMSHHGAVRFAPLGYVTARRPTSATVGT